MKKKADILDSHVTNACRTEANLVNMVHDLFVKVNTVHDGFGSSKLEIMSMTLTSWQKTRITEG